MSAPRLRSVTPVARDPVQWLELLNPATGRVWAEVAEASPDDVDAIVETAAEAYRSAWREVDGTLRGRLLYRWADLVERHTDELARLDTIDTGNLHSESLSDVAGAVNWIRYYAGLADKVEGRSLPLAPHRVGYTLREPFGVVAGVNAYNANTITFAWKAAPALAAGNAVIVKAAELAPASSLRLGELALEAGFPPGVLNVITGRGEVTGRALAEHPGIGRLVLTGSARTAVELTRQAAQSLKALAFELGGKNAVIALPDVDARLFIPSVMYSNFVKAGQSCGAGSRVFLPAARYDELVEAFATAIGSVRPGLPDQPGSQMGSLISRRHRDGIHAAVAQGVAEGGRVVTGGTPLEGSLAEGAYYAPTLVADLRDDNHVARTELFGPVIAILRYDSLDEAIARANALDVGLTAQIWGNDAHAIQRAVRDLEAGTVWVNTARSVHWTAPYGGYKRSGYGRENGIDALDLYTQIKTVMWDTSVDRQLPYGN